MAASSAAPMRFRAGGSSGDVQRDKVAYFQEIEHAGDGAGPSQRQLAIDVVEEDVQAQRLPQQADLLSDMAVSDDRDVCCSSTDP